MNDHALLIDERSREVDRLCLAVQVIIETCAFQNEEGSGYPFQVESFRSFSSNVFLMKLIEDCVSYRSNEDLYPSGNLIVMHIF